MIFTSEKTQFTILVLQKVLWLQATLGKPTKCSPQLDMQSMLLLKSAFALVL